MNEQQRKAMELALKFVEDSECGTANLEAHIKEALAQPEQEPVAWEQFHEHMAGPFYKAPPQRTWVGLTDEEIDYYIVHRLRIATKNNLAALIRMCEAKLKEKNGC